MCNGWPTLIFQQKVVGLPPSDVVRHVTHSFLAACWHQAYRKKLRVGDTTGIIPFRKASESWLRWCRWPLFP
jgi:hypothetical protein